MDRVDRDNPRFGEVGDERDWAGSPAASARGRVMAQVSPTQGISLFGPLLTHLAPLPMHTHLRIVCLPLQRARTGRRRPPRDRAQFRLPSAPQHLAPRDQIPPPHLAGPCPLSGPLPM